MYLLMAAANALILKLLVDLLQNTRSLRLDFHLLPELSNLLFEVLEKANSWSLEQVLLGSELGNDDILFCYRRLRYLHSINCGYYGR
jgi:hypothetical protein